MTNESQIELAQRVHKKVLRLGKIFHNICIANSIPYYMLGGTMLGAIRHKGFIPWDDDMDFGVEREYFTKLVSVLQNQLPKDCRLISKENTRDFYGGFIKIEDRKTLVKERLSEFKYGVTIDIFPLDKTNNNLSFFSYNRLINTLYKIQNYRFHRLKDYGFLKNSISRVLHLLHFPYNKQFIYNIIEKYLLKNKGEYLANHYGAWGIREIVNKSFVGKPELYVFEDTEFFGVQEPEQYLTSLYGERYMTLPPKEKRIFHIKELKERE
ncbi:MAG: LicD family protein [Bacteroidota bacterium]|nr:LicD family protein [Bacteroidota bacterium]